MIVDIHVHPSLEPQTWPAFLARARRNGVDLCLVSILGSNYHDPSPQDVRLCNERAKELEALSKGAVRWLAYVNPQTEGALQEMKRCLDEGAAGVKLLRLVKDAHGGLGHCFPLLEEAGRRGYAVLIHTFGKSDGNCPGELDIRDFAALAQRFPQTNLIAAHINGNWREALAVLRACGPNACADLSGYYPERGISETLLETIGAERILFGSDEPGRNVIAQLTKVLVSSLDERARAFALWKNAARLFRIDAKSVPAAALPTPTTDCPVDLKTDHFCFCGTWPFFETPGLTPGELENELERHGIETAYVADLGALHRIDLARANDAFLASAHNYRRIRPLAVINPRARDWEYALAKASGRFAGVLVSPFLHNWRLDDPACQALFQACANSAVPVWINCALHDIRVRHSGAAWRAVEPGELLEFARTAPLNRYVCQGVAIKPMTEILSSPRKGAEFRFEISRITDYADQYSKVLAVHGSGALLLGTEYPFRDMRCIPWTAVRS